MALLNPSFEDEGTLPGEAAHWTLTAVTSLQQLAGFGTLPEQAWEDFEHWFVLLADLASVLTARAFFDLAHDGVDGFEHGWGLGVFLWELPPAQVVPAAFSVDDVESCEQGWGNDSFLWDWAAAASSTATFDGEPREDFEDQWRTNQSYAWTWAAITSSSALFDLGAQSTEDFENAWTHATTL